MGIGELAGNLSGIHGSVALRAKRSQMELHVVTLGSCIVLDMAQLLFCSDTFLNELFDDQIRYLG